MWANAGRRRELALVCLSALLGACLGGFGLGTWQRGLEPAQVLAGVVAPAPSHPSYYYHQALWHVFGQAGAVLLHAGMDERTLSQLASGLLGATSFAGVSLLALALSGSSALALATPVLLAFLPFDFWGPNYPTWLVGQFYTLGMLGCGVALMALGFLAVGRRAAGLFLLGLLPALHLAWAAWLWSCLAAAWTYGRLKREEPVPGGNAARGQWLGLAAGLAVSALSLVVHLVTKPAAPDLDPMAQKECLVSYLKTAFPLDPHRQPIDLAHPGWTLVALAALLAWCWLRRCRHERPEAVWVARALFVSGVAAIPAGLITWLPDHLVPMPAIQAMPARFANLGVIACPVLVFSCLARTRSLIPRAACVLLLACLHFAAGARLVYWTDWVCSPALLHVALLIGGGAIALVPWRPDAEPERWLRICGAALGTAASLLVLEALLFAAIPHAHRPRLLKRPRWMGEQNSLGDRTLDALFEQARADSGAIITPGGHRFEMVQLRSRRPVLLDISTINDLCYLPAVCPLVDEILHQVYDADLRAERDLRFLSHWDSKRLREHWRDLSPDEWARIRERFSATAVLTPTHWELQLPVVYTCTGGTLFRIPERRSTPHTPRP